MARIRLRNRGVTGRLSPNYAADYESCVTFEKQSYYATERFLFASGADNTRQGDGPRLTVDLTREQAMALLIEMGSVLGVQVGGVARVVHEHAVKEARNEGCKSGIAFGMESGYAQGASDALQPMSPDHARARRAACVDVPECGA